VALPGLNGRTHYVLPHLGLVVEGEPTMRNGATRTDCCVLHLAGSALGVALPAVDVVQAVADALAAGRGEAVPTGRRRAA
jgi:hypothetical protein